MASISRRSLPGRGRVLLAPFPQTEAHRQHAQSIANAVISDRAQPRAARPRSSPRLVPNPGDAAVSKRDHQDTVRRRHPDAMMHPISAGTLMVVPVTNSAQRMPAKRSAALSG